MKGLLRFLQNKKKVDSLLSVEANSEGMSMALVSIGADGERCLKLCQYQACDTDLDVRKSVLRDFVHEHSLRETACNFVLPKGSYNLVLVEAPKVEAAELVDAIAFSIKDMIDIPIANAAIDIFELPEDGTRLGNKMVYAAVAKKDDITKSIELVEESGLSLMSIDICEMALRNVTRAYPDIEGNIALLRLDGRNGLVNLFKDEQLYFCRDFQLSDDIYTNAAQSQLVLELQRSFDHFERQMGQTPPRQILCTGETLADFEFSEDLKHSISGNLEKLNPFSLINCEDEFDPLVLHKSIEAIGGALRAF